MEGITKQPLILLNRIYQFGSFSDAKRNHYGEVPLVGSQRAAGGIRFCTKQ